MTALSRASQNLGRPWSGRLSEKSGQSSEKSGGGDSGTDRPENDGGSPWSSGREMGEGMDGLGDGVGVRRGSAKGGNRRGGRRR